MSGVQAVARILGAAQALTAPQEYEPMHERPIHFARLVVLGPCAVPDDSMRLMAIAVAIIGGPAVVMTPMGFN
jgi:hypothetical protein